MADFPADTDWSKEENWRKLGWLPVSEARKKYAKEDSRFSPDVQHALEAGRTARYRRIGDPIVEDNAQRDPTT